MAEYDSGIHGMKVVEEAITPEMEQMIIQAVENMDQGVHTQNRGPGNIHVWEYGWTYCSNGNAVYNLDESNRIGDIPIAFLELFRIASTKLNVHYIPDHCMINKYEPGQGIYAHKDDERYWGDWVVGICIGSGATMRMTNCQTRETKSHYMFPRTAYLLESESKDEWQHEIPATDHDMIGSIKIPRGVRYAVTFRSIKILPDDLKAIYREYPKYLNE
jgi:alkylated DNA repair dioxygenase AlkB